MTIKEIMKNYEDETRSLSLSKIMAMHISAGFNDKRNATANLNWIKLNLVFPEMHLTLSPINKIPIFRSALISSFENHFHCVDEDSLFTCGYLSMDCGNKLHFLLHSDERVSNSALVGIWVHGVSDVSSLLVLAACMKYILLGKSINRICRPPFPFLLAYFTDNPRETIKYFDVKWPTGPTEEQDAVLNYMNLKLFSASHNLDKYYQTPPDGNSTSFMASCPRLLRTSGLWLSCLKHSEYICVEKDQSK